MASATDELPGKNDTVNGLALLRKPFDEHLISKLPKPTKKQTETVRADFKKGVRCKICGGWHHKDAVHLDYVGHAALTARLLDCDPEWNWEPVSTGPNGEPTLDQHGGMWIRLTVCGVTRMGYGHADKKVGGDAIKETIGDCLRNAAMRFGAALDLWHKGSLHADTDDEPQGSPPIASPEHPPQDKLPSKADARPIYTQAEHDIRTAPNLDALKQIWAAIEWEAIPSDWQSDLVSEKDARIAELKATPTQSAEQSLDDAFPGDMANPQTTGAVTA